MLDWLQVSQYCNGLCGNLASFQTIEDMNQVSIEQGLIKKGNKNFWIGFNNINNDGYRWSGVFQTMFAK